MVKIGIFFFFVCFVVLLCLSFIIYFVVFIFIYLICGKDYIWIDMS